MQVTGVSFSLPSPLPLSPVFAKLYSRSSLYRLGSKQPVQWQTQRKSPRAAPAALLRETAGAEVAAVGVLGSHGKIQSGANAGPLSAAAGGRRTPLMVLSP